MAFLENGSPVATKLGPIATVTTLISGRAAATSIFELTGTTRVWLAMPQTTAGNYNFVTSTGTAIIYVYDTSYELVQEINVNTTSASVTVGAFHRFECEPSATLDLSITPANAKVSSPGGTMALNTITGTGNFGVGTGTATGGTAGYAAGQYAHVIAVGASGGGGGSSYGNSPYGPYGGEGRAGGIGGVHATTTAFALTGTYSLTCGSAGNAGNTSSNGGVANNGNAGGGATTGFGLTANAGNGGNGASSRNSPGNAGTAGSPNLPTDTDIYLGVSNSEIGRFNGTGGNSGGPSFSGTAGNGGRIIVLRWTP